MLLIRLFVTRVVRVRLTPQGIDAELKTYPATREGLLASFVERYKAAVMN